MAVVNAVTLVLSYPDPGQRRHLRMKLDVGMKLHARTLILRSFSL